MVIGTLLVVSNLKHQLDTLVTQCPVYDPWGVYGYNDQYYKALGGACMPEVAWTQTKYQFSNPDEWLYDINNIKGWGDHPDYVK